MEFEFGQDTVITTNDAFVLISVHTSNNTAKFIEQWTKIKNVIDSKPTLTFVICGDFNAKPVSRIQGSVSFLDKENYDEVIMDINFNRNVNVMKFESTTGKVRCLTSQFAKMLSPAFSSIDGFVVISPVGSENNIVETGFSGYIDGGSSFIPSTNEVVYPPLSWPSDHAMVYLKTTSGGICSMNAFGESISKDLPLNIFEIFTKKCWDIFQANESVKTEFSRIKKEFMERQYTIVGETVPSTIGALIKKKHFSTLSRKYAIAGSIFRPPRAFDSRLPQTDFYNHLKSNYEIEYDKFTADLQKQFDLASGNDEAQNKVREILQVVTTITNFYKECMESPILENFFNEWYFELENTKKMTIVDVLSLSMQQLSPEYFCLQEVSEGMLEVLIEKKIDFGRLGYTFDIPTPFKIEGYDNKTRGIIFYKVPHKVKVELYVMHTNDGTKVYLENPPNGIFQELTTKYYSFDSLEKLYTYLFSPAFLDDNYTELFNKNACVKILLEENDILREIIGYDNYEDICVDKKSLHSIME